jgi:zinc transport system ATP-binding protein
VLAGTLVSKPDLVILDEPTQYLDVTSQQEFYKSLNKIKEKTGLTVFMISHDLFTVMKNSDQVICINSHVCCVGKPNDLHENTDFRNALSEIGLYIHSHDHKHEH